MKNYWFKSFTRSSVIAFGLSLLGAPAFAFDLTINPPPSLSIDDPNDSIPFGDPRNSITEGVFTLESAMGYSSTSDTPFFLPGAPVSKDAEIGSQGTKFLIPDVPDDIEVLRLMGNFDASEPDRAPALFDITLFGFNPGIDDFTYFLPSMTGQPLVYQVTDLGPTTALGDNKNIFTSSAPTIIADSNGRWRVTPNNPIGMSRGNFCPPPVVHPHGGGGGTPPPPCVSVPEPGSAIGIFALGFLGIGSMLKRKLNS
ncbi:MAG: PEP-CTERM sorting domain-containing protein [Cyanobacteria bacterium P01_H01_bin.35]